MKQSFSALLRVKNEIEFADKSATLGGNEGKERELLLISGITQFVDRANEFRIAFCLHKGSPIKWRIVLLQ